MGKAGRKSKSAAFSTTTPSKSNAIGSAEDGSLEVGDAASGLKKKHVVYHSFCPPLHPVMYSSTLPDIHFQTVVNDGSDIASTKLIALKNIFSRQLPKMPKDYIVRLVFDNRHTSLAILRQDRIIGGICYRAYPEQRFAEIAFLAINSNEQVRGYGTVLMNQLKHHVQKERIEYFLTYADNFAIGYFQKQGFSKQVAMPKERWVGFIKDYDGGTLMECYIQPNVDYLHVSEIVAVQRQFLHDRMNELKQANVVYRGLECAQCPGGGRVPSLLDVPGVSAAGWTAAHLYKGSGSTDRDRQSLQNRLTAFLKTIFDKIKALKDSKHFLSPLNESSDPSSGGGDSDLSLSIIQNRIKSGDYYRCKEALRADLLRMLERWRVWSEKNDGPDSETYSAAVQMVQQVTDTFKEMKQESFST